MTTPEYLANRLADGHFDADDTVVTVDEFDMIEKQEGLNVLGVTDVDFLYILHDIWSIDDRVAKYESESEYYVQGTFTDVAST